MMSFFVMGMILFAAIAFAGGLLWLLKDCQREAGKNLKEELPH